MQTLFEPRSILVVGVSTRPHNMGRHIVENLVQSKFRGEIHLFGRNPGTLFERPILTSWDEVPPGIDLAALLVPAALVPETFERLGERDIRRAIVSTGGFSELGPEGERLQEQALAVAHKHGIRFTGPNGLGVINTAVGLSTPFMRLPVARPGRTHVLAQSGGVGLYYLNRLQEEGLGIGIFVSLGNKLDTDENDLLEYIAGIEPEIVALYLEGVEHGRRFLDLIADYPCPVLIHKANTSAAGARAAASHTAALTNDDEVLSAAIRQVGAFRAKDSNEMLNAARAFSLPPMRGDRLLIVSRSGGHGVIAADTAEPAGFQLPPIPEDIVQKVSGAFRAGVIRLGNPLDLGDLFDFAVYVAIVEEALQSPDYDGVFFYHVYGPPEAESARRFIEAVGKLSRKYDKPVYMALMVSVEEAHHVRQNLGLPIFLTPEEAVEAARLSRVRYHRGSLPAEAPLTTPALADPEGVAGVIAEARARGRRMLGQEALRIAELAGFPVAPFRVVTEATDLARLSREVGFPLAMKILSPDISHKTDADGVVLDVADEEKAGRVYERLLSAANKAVPDARIDGVLLQRMNRGMREIFLGGKRDPNFGPVVMVGLGGVAVELFHDVSLRLAPLRARDIDEMISEVVSFRALKGARGLPAADLPVLREAVARMANLMVACPDIEEIDLNPMKLHREGRGGMVVDARVLLTEPS